jgi:hypothetical protein
MQSTVPVANEQLMKVDFTMKPLAVKELHLQQKSGQYHPSIWACCKTGKTKGQKHILDLQFI